MGDDIELVSDGEGLAIIGKPGAVERFMSSVGLAETDAPGAGTVFSTGASIAQAGSEIAASSGRWVKLTEDSAAAVKQFGLTPTKTPGVSHAMVGDPGNIKQWIQIVQSPGAMLTNPAVLAGAAGIMAQLAMKQQMDEITDYLAIIDEKLDSVLRAQTNQVLARLDGVDLAIREAMSVRGAVGRVSEVTWSKVQNSAQLIHETQGYALRQLADLADKVEEKQRINDLAAIAKDAEAEVQKWLVVLARCFELQDAVGVLELDRVLDASPDELDRHRLGLAAARREQLELLSAATEYLLERMNTAVTKANSKVLFNPKQSPAVIASTNNVAVEVQGFHELLGIEPGGKSHEARRWKEAASERWEQTRTTGAQGVDRVKRFGGETREHAGSVKGKLSGKLSRRGRHKDDEEEQSGSAE